MSAATVVLILVLIAPFATWLFFLSQFNRTPQKHWANQVLALVSRARRLHQGEADRAALLDRQFEQQVDEKSAAAFAECCKAVTVEALSNYDGIGPGTVSKLREYRVHTLADLWRFNPMSIPGIGEKRCTDILRAARDLEVKVRAQFDRRELPAARRLEEEIAALRHQLAWQKNKAQARMQAAERLLRQLQQAEAEALEVTFFRWLSGNLKAIPSNLLQLPEVNLEAELQAAAAAVLPPSMTVKESATSAKPAVAATAPTTDFAQQPQPSLSTPPAASASGAEAAPLAAHAQVSPSPSVAEIAAPGQAGQQAVPGKCVKPPSPEECRAAFVETGIALAMVVARAHGRITQAERRVIDQFVARQTQDDPVLANKGRNWLAYYESTAIDLKKQLLQAEKYTTQNERLALLQLAKAVAAASNDIDPQEIVILDRIAAQWEIPWKDAQDEAERHAPSADVKQEQVSADSPSAGQASSGGLAAEPRATLEIPEGVAISADLIRRQYRQLMERYDPAKVERFGPEFVAIARSKREAVAAAAALLIQPLGEPLELPETQPSPAELRHNPDLDELFA